MLTNLLANPFFWVALVLGIGAGYIIRQTLAARQADSVEQRLKTSVEKANTQTKEIVSKAKDEAAALLQDAKVEEKERKTQLAKLEERHLKKEESLDKQLADLQSQKTTIETKEKALGAERVEIDELREKVRSNLEKVAKLSFEDAKTALLKQVKKEYADELASSIQKLEGERKEEVEKRALGIITTAIQRYARSHVADVTTSAFQLPNEEIKGKIIGREGRNIRTLERLTGVEIIVDETPDTVVISSFDPFRRELARLALEKLIKDGRIQPVKIEEKVEEARKELDRRVQEIGDNATLEVGIVGLPKELIQLLGRLYFRTSFGQNVLVHSIEMTHIAGMLASELGASVEVAKKGALLHDIGKAIDHEVEGTHVEIGKKLLKKYEIDEAVIKAMESHHEEYPYATSESYIVAAADILSSARPGARRGTVENYLKRLQDLEKIATSFDGVRNAYAVSAGREIRVFVVPEKIDDFGALQMAKDIASKIETEIKYPGEIKINVIREMRAVEVAR